MRYFSIALVGMFCAVLAACASSSKNIDTAYVSPLQYKSYDCDQISMESQRVSARASTLAGELDENATGDAVAMGVGLVLFWPALFFIDGNGPQATEYSQLKGEYVALEQASIEKKCDLAFQEIKEPPAPEPASPAAKFGQPQVGTAATPTD